MDPDSRNERRRTDRVEKQTFASLSAEDRDGQAHTLAVVSDVSEHGLGVRSPDRFYPGEEIVLRVAAGNQLHRLAGVVRRCSSDDAGLWHVGIELAGNAAEGQTLLTALQPCTIVRA